MSTCRTHQLIASSGVGYPSDNHSLPTTPQLDALAYVRTPRRHSNRISIAATTDNPAPSATGDQPRSPASARTGNVVANATGNANVRKVRTATGKNASGYRPASTSPR